MNDPVATAPKSNTALLALIAVNLLPLAGVMQWGWSLFEIVFVYWCETLIVGGITVLKIVFAMPELRQGKMLITLPNRKHSVPLDTTKLPANFMLLMKMILVPFFIIHYGMFCMGHATFIFSIFGDDNAVNGERIDLLDTRLRPFLFVCLALAASHMYSFFVNYIAGGEFRRSNPMQLMTSPYKRIVVMHLTIIFGGFLAMLLGAPIWMLVMMVALKIGTDIRAHRRERGHFTTMLPAKLRHDAGISNFSENELKSRPS